jgi:Spy/CpxP family protein refolding chaperone
MVVASPVVAQDPPERRGGGRDRAELEQRFRARMDRMVQERLGLDDAAIEELRGVTSGFDERRRALGRAEYATSRRVEALLAEGSTNDSEARELLDRMAQLRVDESALFAEEQDALLEVLTPTQVLQLHALRRELGDRIRALRNRRDGEGRRRPGGGGGEPFPPWLEPGM